MNLTNDQQETIKSIVDPGRYLLKVSDEVKITDLPAPNPVKARERKAELHPPKSGYTGVDFVKDKDRGYKPKWRARISRNGKTIVVGYFATAEEAHQAREKVLDR